MKKLLEIVFYDQKGRCGSMIVDTAYHDTASEIAISASCCRRSDEYITFRIIFK